MQSPSSTRERLLVAAETHFAERGFAGAKLADIARDIGATTGTFYGQFDSKTDLVVELLAERDAAFLEEVSMASTFQDRCTTWLEVAYRYRGAYRSAHELMRSDVQFSELVRTSREHNGALLGGVLESPVPARHRDFLGRLTIDTLGYLLTTSGNDLGDEIRLAVCATVGRMVERGLYSAPPSTGGSTKPRRSDRADQLFIAPVIEWHPAPGRLPATSRRGGAQRNRIAACAAEVFGERGLSAATVEMVAARADVSAGSVYRYFEDKHDLFNYLLSAAEVDLYERALMEVDDDGRFLVTDAARGHLKARRVHQGVFRAWMELLGTDTPAAAAWDHMNAQFRSALVAALKRSQRAGHMDRHLDPVLAAQVVMALSYQSATVRLDLGWEPEMDEDEFIEVLSAVVGAGF